MRLARARSTHKCLALRTRFLPIANRLAPGPTPVTPPGREPPRTAPVEERGSKARGRRPLDPNPDRCLIGPPPGWPTIAMPEGGDVAAHDSFMVPMCWTWGTPAKPGRGKTDPSLYLIVNPAHWGAAGRGAGVRERRGCRGMALHESRQVARVFSKCVRGPHVEVGSVGTPTYLPS